MYRIVKYRLLLLVVALNFSTSSYPPLINVLRGATYVN